MHLLEVKLGFKLQRLLHISWPAEVNGFFFPYFGVL